MRDQEINELFNDIQYAKAEIRASYSPHTPRSDDYELAKILSEKYFTLKEGFKPIWLKDNLVVFVKCLDDWDAFMEDNWDSAESNAAWKIYEHLGDNEHDEAIKQWIRENFKLI